MADNANFAVAQSTRPYIALLHHDDVYRRDMLERWADVLDRHPDVGFVFNQYEEQAPLPLQRLDERMEGGEFLRKRLLRTWGCPVRGTAMIRRSAWDAVGGLDARYGLLADIDLWMRLAGSWAVGYVNEPLITVRHERPAGYPAGYVRLSFARNRLLYEIHAAHTSRRMLPWLRLRTRVSVDGAKWLAYAAVRRRDLLGEAVDGATPIEFAPIRLARSLIGRMSRAATA
jgi:GT2 family glycosyltransferase